MLKRVSIIALTLALCLGAGAQTDPEAEMRKAIDAIRAGKIEELKSLLESHPKLVSEVDRQYKATLLHWAAAQKDLRAATLLIDGYKASLVKRNKEGATPLQVAIVPTPGKQAGQDFLELVKKLSNQESVGIANFDGKTALHLACQYNQLEVARYLIEEMKADVNARTRITRKEPLDYAREAKNDKIVQLLLAAKEKLKPPPPPPPPAPPPEPADSAVTLRAAARDGNVAEVRRILLKHPEWIDRNDEHHETPLLIAAKNCRVEVVVELIRAGADLKSKDPDGHTFCDLLCVSPPK